MKDEGWISTRKYGGWRRRCEIVDKMDGNRRWKYSNEKC